MCLFNGRGEISTPHSSHIFLPIFLKLKTKKHIRHRNLHENLVKIGSPGASRRTPKFWPYILGYPFFVLFAQRPGHTARRTATNEGSIGVFPAKEVLAVFFYK